MKQLISPCTKQGFGFYLLLCSLCFCGSLKAQLYSSGNNSISGNMVGIGVNTPSSTLHLKDLSGPVIGGGMAYHPILTFQATDPTVSPASLNFWDINMNLSGLLTFSNRTGSNSQQLQMTLSSKGVSVANKLYVANKLELASAIAPDGTTGSVLSLGLTELGTSGAWQGSGAAIFSNASGELFFMNNSSGTLANTSEMLGNTTLKLSTSEISYSGKGVFNNPFGFSLTSNELNYEGISQQGNSFVFKATELGLTFETPIDRTFADLTFSDPNIAGADKRAFVFRSLGPNHPDAPNTIEFWDPHGNGQAYFTMPVRIGGSYDDVSVINSGYDLYVAGGIRSTTVKVDAYSNWPDYVFAPTYKLMSLKATEEYINENQHLPGVPSAAEIQETGIDLAEMNAILLKKIEELTLQLIDLQKQVDTINKP